MASRFWVGGTGTWNVSDTSHWSATSGGSSGASVPNSSDDATFDSASNATAYSVNISSGATCLSLTIGNPASGVITIDSINTTSVAGNFYTASGVLINSINLRFTATSGTKTITTNGVVIATDDTGSVIIFDGVGGTFQLADDLSIKTYLSLTAGTFDPNGKKVTLKSSSSGYQPLTGSFTFYDLSIIPSSPSKDNSFILTSNVTITNTFLISNGATATNRVYVRSNIIGTPRTITAASTSISNADFRDITGAGAASWDMSAASGGSGDCGGNSMKSLGSAAFTSATTQHWINVNGGNWSTSGNWTSRVPLPQDNVVMDAVFGTSKTVTQDMPRIGKSIDWTGATWTTALTWDLNSSLSSQFSIFGSLILISGLTLSNSGILIILEGRSSYTFDSKSITIQGSVTLDAPGGTISLGGNSTIGVTGTLTITNGTFSTSASNYVLSTGKITIGSSGTLTLGTETDLLTGTGTVFTGTGTINPGTSTLKITDSSNTGITFGGGGKTYNNIWFSRGASTGANDITGTNTFNDFKDTGTAAHSLRLTAGTTNTVTTFSVSGSSGNLITINSVSGTSTHALVKSGGGTISSDYLNIQHSVATPGTTWYSGTHSTNNQAVSNAGSGWIFTAAPSSNSGFGMFF